MIDLNVENGRDEGAGRAEGAQHEVDLEGFLGEEQRDRDVLVRLRD